MILTLVVALSFRISMMWEIVSHSTFARVGILDRLYDPLTELILDNSVILLEEVTNKAVQSFQAQLIVVGQDRMLSLLWEEHFIPAFLELDCLTKLVQH